MTQLGRPIHDGRQCWRLNCGLLLNIVDVLPLRLYCSQLSNDIHCGLSDAFMIEKKYGVFYNLLPELATNDAWRWLHYIWKDIIWTIVYTHRANDYQFEKESKTSFRLARWQMVSVINQSIKTDLHSIISHERIRGSLWWRVCDVLLAGYIDRISFESMFRSTTFSPFRVIRQQVPDWTHANSVQYHNKIACNIFSCRESATS